ncbi:Thiol-disulfide isomerase or thioredoxin [Mariprofundus ferrinatatus]|uniref:Thiol-disulfide isomerase or thioredoxin n=1 Tax=Mariprofundus ferrinatatus TaxID=1921087 RepID=A0A2K8L1K1_9PROT|nr:TlpA disulfide reductase family protein [Mariprofundus ferrinatatus]ATX80962.1 Thiol-disulfide isomerase or thioredoxin [Mariprofundus ferrinatatus]
MMNHRFRFRMNGLLLLAVILGLSACSEEAVPTAKKGERLPSFTMQSISGEMVESSKLFAGKVVVLNLWATWCPPCRDEMPDLVKLSKLLPSDKFMVAGLSVDSSLDTVKTFVQEQQVTFPMYWDQGGSSIAMPIFRSRAFPETFVLNAEGVVVEMVAGAFPWGSPEVVDILNVIQKTGKLPAPEPVAVSAE